VRSALGSSSFTPFDTENAKVLAAWILFYIFDPCTTLHISARYDQKFSSIYIFHIWCAELWFVSARFDELRRVSLTSMNPCEGQLENLWNHHYGAPGKHSGTLPLPEKANANLFVKYSVHAAWQCWCWWSICFMFLNSLIKAIMKLLE